MTTGNKDDRSSSPEQPWTYQVHVWHFRNGWHSRLTVYKHQRLLTYWKRKQQKHWWPMDVENGVQCSQQGCHFISSGVEGIVFGDTQVKALTDGTCFKLNNLCEGGHMQENREPSISSAGSLLQALVGVNISQKQMHAFECNGQPVLSRFGSHRHCGTVIDYLDLSVINNAN